jgi:hypothetical protein
MIARGATLMGGLTGEGERGTRMLGCGWIMLLLFVFAVSAESPGKINGVISDVSTGEKLSYANVVVEGTKWGGISNKNGYYFVQDVAPGKYVVTVSYLSYEKHSKEIVIEPGLTTRLNFELRVSPIQLKGVSVSAERERFERDIRPSTYTLRKADLQKAPVVGGEADLFRSLQLMPGVIASSDFSSQLYVRGGSPDQNLILLDDITVYNPSHLGGLFSIFNVDALKDAELVAGGFPAKYGGRMSSVLNITSKEGNRKRFSTSSAVSLISAKTLVEGPLPRGSWMITARRTYFDKIFKNTDLSFPYYFYDGIARVDFDVTANASVTGAGLLGEDVLDFSLEEDGEEFGHLKMQWGNRGISGKWRQIYTPRFYGETAFAWSNFRTSLNLGMHESTIRFSNEVIDYTAKSDFTYTIAPNHTIDFGFDAKQISFDFEVEMDTMKFLDDTDTASVFAVYIQDKWEITPLCLVQFGVRPTHYTLGSWQRLEPRVGLKYRIGMNTTLNASGGLFSQFLTTVQTGEELFTIFDVWLPIGERYEPGLCAHYILGTEHWISNDLKCIVESYYKNYTHLVELNQEESNREEDSFNTGSGYATGLDFQLKKTAGRFSGWVSYSLALTKRTFNDTTFCPRYDRRHNLSLVFETSLPWGLKLSFTQLFGTGFPYPGVIGRCPKTEYDFSGDSLVTYWENIMAPRDYYRYPAYHRADVGLSKGFRWGPVTGAVYVDVVNAYNHENVFLYIWDLEADPPIRRTITMFPRLPSVGFNIRF